MKKKEISDDEIQILGKTKLNELGINSCRPACNVADNYKEFNYNKCKSKSIKWLWLFIVFALLIVGGFIAKNVIWTKQNKSFETVSLSTVNQDDNLSDDSKETSDTGYIEISEETVNDVRLRIFSPHNAVPELVIDVPAELDSSVVFVVNAADAGKNNYGILGDYVLKGEILARGANKEGYCAIINNTLTIGISNQTPLFEQSIREKGYFFRQYPLVKHSEPVENKPKNKSIRRALAIREGEIIMIQSLDRESFHDFAQALADAGVNEAIYLPGGVNGYGWWRDKAGAQTFWGEKPESHLKGANFLVWRK
jgi:hypothetical protein